MTLTENQQELLKEIIAFGKRKNFDFENFTKLSLDQLMLDWITESKDFQKKVKSTDTKTLLGIFGLK